MLRINILGVFSKELAYLYKYLVNVSSKSRTFKINNSLWGAVEGSKPKNRDYNTGR